MKMAKKDKGQTLWAEQHNKAHVNYRLFLDVLRETS
jgi:hypothetical protein